MMIFREWLRSARHQDGASMRTGLLIAAAAALFALPAAAQDTSQQSGQSDQKTAAAQPGWIKICGENPKDKTKICNITRERR